MLKDIFISLLSKYSTDPIYIESLWKEIEKKHNSKRRYYHNLTHLEHIYYYLIEIKDEIQDWDMVLFALFYHDYIYDVLKKDNEEQSAIKAVSVLNSLTTIKKERIKICKEIILATKGHNISNNQDINYFTDADLSILGADQENYKIYTQNVRKEYKYYPDFMYQRGRIKVLNHFKEMSRIYKTEHFFKKFETQAKSNLTQEINLLSK